MKRKQIFLPIILTIITLIIAMVFIPTAYADGPTGEIDPEFGGFTPFGRVLFDNFTAIDFT